MRHTAIDFHVFRGHLCRPPLRAFRGAQASGNGSLRASPLSRLRARLTQRRMMPSIDQLIVWIIVGLLGGSLAGLLTTWERRGFGLFRNLAVGLAGALIGGLLFRMLGLFPGRRNESTFQPCAFIPH